MKTLITGANGFVGSAILRAVLKQGIEVKVLVRPNADRRNFDGLDIEIVEGDLLNPASLKRAVIDCDHVYHVAADYRLWVPDPKRMYQINVDGCRALMIAASEVGVKKIVYTSSVATLGTNKNGSPANETTASSLQDMIGHYKRSKYLAEQEVNDLIRKMHIPATIVNPSAPVGPRDIKPTPTGRIILNTMQQRMPAYVDTGLNIVHVDDVANGHIMAMNKGRIGERYILGGDNMTLASILEYICLHENLTPPKIKIPHHFIFPIAWCMERIANITKKEPLATVDGVRMSKKIMFFSSKKAIDELGYQSRPGTTGLKDAMLWFKQNEYQ